MEINITLLKKMGYYVATAFRAYGIPTRYVEGHYLSGDDIHSEASGINKLTGADAHAWVEVYFDGVGWALFGCDTRMCDRWCPCSR